MKTTLGRTGLTVNKDGFGVLPLQRASMDEAVRILNRALDNGIDYYDTARGYTDSEEKIGKAISSRRGEFILATKTMARDAGGFLKDLETSLINLKTDHIDIYQFHNPQHYPKPGDSSGLYEAMLKAKEQGKIRFIGITNHRLPIARAAVESGLYDTLQFPFNYLSDEKEAALVRLCAEKNIGFICMKALSGGLITDVAAARSHLASFPNALPIWGIQSEGELDALLNAQKLPAVLSEEQKNRIAKDREELTGNFCRACGYCLPCPAEIEITMCARMSLLLRRMPAAPLLSENWRREMAKIPECQHCNHCKDNCPYGLDTPSLLARNYADYQKALEAAGIKLAG
jgi:aryl-alcohol dehydrogenase-like predicted oxidoreductase